jgi:lysine 6-dehydrogenase
MGFRYVVLGAGRQGTALAFDLACNGDAERVGIADLDLDAAHKACQRLSALCAGRSARFEALALDVHDGAAVRRTLTGSDVALSAVPYRYNAALAAAAIEARTSFLDLGGNTDVVRAELALHERAVAAGVAIVPDCGLAPGLGNHLAAHGVAMLERAEHVHVRCGGLPQRPVGPLGYKLVFHFDGLINEYSGVGEFLRDGRRVDVPTLTEVEELDFGPPLGVLEAAVTSGGTSTCPQTWLGKLHTFDYKTLRYPGHWSSMRLLFELGCFEQEVRAADGRSHSPRATLRALFEEQLRFPDVRDLVVLRTTVRGRSHGRSVTRRYDLLDFHDERTGFTAMERTTAFPAALVGHFMARKLVEPGARPLEVAIDPARYLEELPAHGIHVRYTQD